MRPFTQVIVSLTVVVVALVALVIVELLSSAPLLDMRLFRDRSFTGGVIVNGVLQMGLFGSLFLIPVFLGSLRGQDAFDIGLVLLPSALVTIVVLPITGILTDRIGGKVMVVIGSAVMALSGYLLSHLSLATPFFTLQIWLMARSVALAFAVQTAQIIALANIKPHQISRASALYNVLRQVAAAFSTSILATYVADHRKLHYAHLAEWLTPNSPAALFVRQVVQRAQLAGTDVRVAQAQAGALIAGQLQQQASVLAFQDAFMLIGVVSLVGVLVALFIKSPKKGEGSGEAMIME